ncbi:MAG: DUF177 domain-containing protein [Burkholderiales bacterium]|nr:DUF177 domain-containing protein [Burkholderiales bacterium]
MAAKEEMSELIKPNATVDTNRLAREEQEISGVIAVKQMDRLKDRALNPDGEFTFTIKGMTGKLGWPGAYVEIKGTLELECSRCNTPMELAIDRDVVFRFTKTEAEADSIPFEDPEDPEVIVGGDKLNILDWIEEEILLSIPYFPVHEGQCPTSEIPKKKEDNSEADKTNPFAKLKELKGLRKADQ